MTRMRGAVRTVCHSREIWQIGYESVVSLTGIARRTGAHLLEPEAREVKIKGRPARNLPPPRRERGWQDCL